MPSMFTKNSTTCPTVHRQVNHLTPISTKSVSQHHIQNGLASLYKYNNTYTRGPHGTSRAPPPGPLSGGGAPPARGPSGPGGSHPVIATPATAALWIRVHNSIGRPTHCSKTPSSWIHVHMPSGTPCSTTSNRW
jgi:hypothetical protein